MTMTLTLCSTLSMIVYARTHTAGVIAVSGSAAGGFVPPLPDDILLPPVPVEEGEDVY
jgi:hypothetical protein